MRLSVPAAVRWLFILLLAASLPACQSGNSADSATANDLDSTNAEEIFGEDELVADAKPVARAAFPQDVQTLLDVISNAATGGTNSLQPYVDGSHPVQFLHSSNGTVPNLDVLTADELMGVSEIVSLVRQYKPDSTEHFLNPPNYNSCDPRTPGVYLINLEEPFTVLSSLYTSRMEETGGEVNPRKLEALRQVDNEVRQILHVWLPDASGTLQGTRIFLRRNDNKLYIAAVDVTNCN